jgi:3-methyladenine DNA glycosylase AlkD
MTTSTRPIVKEITDWLQSQANPAKAAFLQSYFKTGPGQYAEGDIFIGITVPAIRQVAKKYWRGVQEPDLRELLSSPIHEYRLLALIMMTIQYQRGDADVHRQLYEFYLSQTTQINNWDLVDQSAPTIVGLFLVDHPEAEATITNLLASANLWERRIAVLAMFPFIKKHQFALPLKHITALLKDEHDLIHKATGWALRNIGVEDRQVLIDFLDEHAATMPRTALRYAIEHLPETTRQHYLQLKVQRSCHA